MSNIAKLPNMQEDDGPRPPLEFKDTDQPLNPFDPKNLTVAPDYRALVGEPLLTAIKVGKPGKDHFFRVRPGAENYLPQAAILEFNPANERDAGRYLVLNGLVPKFMSSPKLGAHIRICNLYTCVTRQALPFLWALPQDDGSALRSATARPRSPLNGRRRSGSIFAGMQSRRITTSPPANSR